MLDCPPISKASSRLGVLLVLMLFLVSQGLGIQHLIKHSEHGNNDACRICDTAAHLGDATLPTADDVAVLPMPAAQVAQMGLPYYFAFTRTAYASRAPPAFS